MQDDLGHEQRTPDPAPALSRRGLLKGAAAGALAYSFLGGRGAAAAPGGPPGGEGLVPESGDVSGGFHPRFQRVRDEFVRNFAERGEVGASVCVIVSGRTVVDLWGGTARVDTAEPWAEDTLVHVWSCTKGTTALCAHILAARGLLDLDAPVVDYWPGFGQNGKQGVTVAMLLSHQAGVPALRDPLPPGAFYDWDSMVDRLAAEELFWEPGTRHGYHALTFGYLVGEVVRRVSGRSPGTFFREEVAEPLGLDFSIGLPDSELSRLAPIIPADPPTPPFSLFLLNAITDPTSIAALVLFNNGGYLNPGEAESPAARAAETGATNAFTNARGLARLYAALAPGGAGLVDRATLARMARVESAGVDAMGYIPSRFSLGYVKSIDNRRQSPGNQDSGILSEDAFGHSGFGGSIGFVDPRAGLAFGYAMNKQGQGTLLNARGQSLIDATYRALGYEEAGGNWVPAEPRGGRRT
jgi:CubicO group peptidase (beta-lactamase class C family)